MVVFITHGVTISTRVGLDSLIKKIEIERGAVSGKYIPSPLALRPLPAQHLKTAGLGGS